jgi:hypothetical protein
MLQLEQWLGVESHLHAGITVLIAIHIASTKTTVSRPLLYDWVMTAVFTHSIACCHCTALS